MTVLSDPTAVGAAPSTATGHGATAASPDSVPGIGAPPDEAIAAPAIPREVHWLQIGSAAASAALLAASLATVAPWGADIYAFAPTAALFAIVAAFAGGQRRFGKLAHAKGWQFWGGAGLGLAGLAAVITLGTLDTKPAPWVALLTGIGYFLAMGMHPLLLARRAAPSGLPQETSPTAPARFGAATFALAFGGLIWIMADPLGRDTLHLALLLVVLAVTLPSRWGLARSARTWRARQWLAFGIALTAMVVAALGAQGAGSWAGTLGCIAGAVAAVALILATAARPARAASTSS